VSAALGEQEASTDALAHGGWSQPLEALPGVDAPADPVPPVEPGSGRLVAVWGGRPARPGGRRSPSTWPPSSRPAGCPTLLADADVYGGVVAQVLGFLDEAPGLAAATRLANNGQLDLAALAAVAPQAAPNLRVLTGISRADRWPELRPAALEQVWMLCRSLAAVTVVDLGFCLEQDEELSFDTAAPRRNGATLATLDAADTVLAVGAADPVGMQRLVRGLTQLGEVVPGALPRVVLNRVRRGAGRRGARGSARRGAGALRRGAATRRTCRRTGVRSTRPAAGPRPARGRRPARRPASRWPASRPAWSADRPESPAGGLLRRERVLLRDDGAREVQRRPRAGRLAATRPGDKPIDGWCEPLPDGRQQWREAAIDELLDTEDADVLFVAGCEENQVGFHPRFVPDHPVERADRDRARAAGRADQQPVRQVRGGTAAGHRRHRGRRAAAARSVPDHEVVTTAPLDEVVTTVAATRRGYAIIEAGLAIRRG
jgi:hypothetical protein